MARIGTPRGGGFRWMFVLVVMALAVFAPSASAAVSAPGSLWFKFLDGPLKDFDQPHQIAFSSDGKTTYVTGGAGVKFDPANFAGAVNDYETAAYRTATGQLLWSKRYNGPGKSEDEALSIGVSADGTRVFVTGRSYAGTIGPQQFATISYNAATGAQQWVRLYTGLAGSTSYVPRLVTSPTQNRVYVAGSSDGSTTSQKVWVVIAYDGATGAQLWVKRSAQAVGHQPTGNEIAINPDGRTVYVEGVTVGGSKIARAAFETAAYRTSDGAVRWTSRFNAEGADIPTGITVSASGERVYVAGERWVGFTTFPDAQAVETISYDAATGTSVWRRRFQKATGTFDEANGIATAHGRIVVVGDTYDGSTAALQTIAYDSTGARLWVRRYDADTTDVSDFGSAVAASADGLRFYVTGSVGIGIKNDIETIAYTAISGIAHWKYRFDSRSDSDFSFDFPEDLGVAPGSGRVLVTGRAYGPTTSQNPTDWATIAYAG